MLYSEELKAIAERLEKCRNNILETRDLKNKTKESVDQLLRQAHWAILTASRKR